MEAAGLAIGTISLIGAFKDVIDLFALFTASRSFGRDSVILLTKFDIEKYLLLQWAEQVNLLHHTDGKFDDGRLKREEVQSSVAQILSCIRLLLSDAVQLRERYGVKDVSGILPGPLVNNREEAVGMSRPCMERFEQRFRELNISIKERQSSATTWAKARWVIQDKRKFGDLISELAHFTTKLREILPPTATSLSRRAELVSTGDLEEIADLDKLKILLAASAGHRGAIAGLTQELIDRKCQERILGTLWYRGIDQRRDSISPAHCKTFQWALEPPGDRIEETIDNLSVWLRSGSGIYWVSGKAGSGKSTFMKFLYSSPRVRELLSEWSRPEECTLADFFFHYLGIPEQNTQAGLSKALLFKILSCCPTVIGKALPNLWREVNEGKEDISPPSPPEIDYAFEVISSYRSLPPICLFIDGFDEYVGDHRRGIAFLSRLTMNPKLKIVTSSRPEPHCVAAFEELPTLALQSLTAGDIALYVQDMIGENKYMKRLLRSDPIRSAEVMEEIVHKSSGVFLWVVLACRSLLDGFDDYDRMEELQARVRELPEELKEMFTHMLRRIDGRHASQASRLLRLAFLHKKRQGQRSAELVPNLYALEFAFLADYLDLGPEFAPIRFVSDPDRSEVCEQLAGRLRSRCGGLLEVAKRGPEHTISRWNAQAEEQTEFCFCSTADWSGGPTTTAAVMEGEWFHDAWADAMVVFMHRSVFDYLDTDEVWESGPLQAAAAEFDFAAVMSLSRLYLALQSQRVRCPGELHQVLACLGEGIAWGVEADRNRPESEENIFWKMSPCLDALMTVSDPVSGFWSGQFESLSVAQSHGHAALIIAIEAGASSYVKRQLRLFDAASLNHPDCGCLPFLQYAVEPSASLLLGPQPNDIPLAWEGISSSDGMIGVLLSAGCDPNGIMGVSTFFTTLQPAGFEAERVTAWRFWLQRCTQLLSCYPDKATLEAKASILNGLEAFIRADADLESTEMEVESIRRVMWTDPRLSGNLTRVLELYNKRRKAQGPATKCQTGNKRSLPVDDAGSCCRKRRE